MGSAATARPDLAEALTSAIRDFGWSVAPDDAYQMLRGMRTLATRMERHAASGLVVAKWLEQHAAVAKVLYPALPGADDHDLWKRDYAGAAAVFSVVFKPCSDTAIAAFLDELRIFQLGYSWGGFESLALNCDPQFSARQWPPKLAGPSVRLSIGLEDPADLIADLEAGIAAMAGV
jgi:cystathionine beta-lyase